jgi:hypothetical protein
MRSAAICTDVLHAILPGRGILGRLIRRRTRSLFRRGRRAAFFVTLPDGTSRRVAVYLMPPFGPWAESVGLERIDGWLGTDFLREWVVVFDFAGGAVSLFAT